MELHSPLDQSNRLVVFGLAIDICYQELLRPSALQRHPVWKQPISIRQKKLETLAQVFVQFLSAISLVYIRVAECFSRTCDRSSWCPFSSPCTPTQYSLSGTHSTQALLSLRTITWSILEQPAYLTHYHIWAATLDGRFVIYCGTNTSADQLLFCRAGCSKAESPAALNVPERKVHRLVWNVNTCGDVNLSDQNRFPNLWISIEHNKISIRADFEQFWETRDLTHYFSNPRTAFSLFWAAKQMLR